MATVSRWTSAVAQLSDEDRVMFDVEAADIRTILSNILGAVESERDKCQRGRWKTISLINGKDIIIRDVCNKIARYVKGFMGAIDIAVQADPLHAGLPWAGVRVILQLCLDNADMFHNIAEGLEKVSNVIVRTALIESAYSQPDCPGMQSIERELENLTWPRPSMSYRQTIDGAFQNLLKAEKSLQELTRLIDGERVHKITERTENLKIKADNISADTTSIRAVQLSLQQTLEALSNPMMQLAAQTSSIYAALQDTERNKILLWLSTIQAQEHNRASQASLIPGSGQWLVENPLFLSWVQSSSSETFWLHGSPGTGKTKLATVVIDHLRGLSAASTNTAPMALFYCSRDSTEPERSNAAEILRCLAKQLSITQDGHLIRDATLAEYQKKNQAAVRSGESPGLLTVEESTKLIIELNRSSPALIIIDALDECEANQRALLLSAFKKISDYSRDIVKIFISSREEQDIKGYLCDARDLQLTAELNNGDVQRFIETKVDQFILHWAVIHSESVESLQHLRTEMINSLQQGAQGMFLWVALQLELISDTDKIRDSGDIRVALRELPDTLNRSYDALRNKITSLGRTSRSIAISVLQWLLCSQRLLSVEELVAAVDRTSEDRTLYLNPDAISHYCCGLVIIDRDANVFRLFHPTVREYLESSKDLFSLAQCHFTAAQRCLGVYLWPHDSDQLQDYSVKYWPRHLEQLCGSSQRSEMRDQLVAFFTQDECFEDWAELVETRSIGDGGSWDANLERKLNASMCSPPSPLFAACCFGIVEVLDDPEISNMADLQQKNGDGISGLYLASRWGHVDVVARLLEHYVAFNHRQEGQYGTPLGAAAFAGHDQIVELLLQHGADPSCGAGEFPTALDAAFTNRYESVAQIILKRFQCDTQEVFDHVLNLASFNGAADIVHQLLDQYQACGFSPSTSCQPDPLQVALYGGKTRRVQTLIQSELDINRVGGYFDNALQAAIAGGKLHLVKLVVEAGAKLDTRGRFGFPLRAAAVTGSVEIVEYLLNTGADVNTRDGELGDALQAAAAEGFVDIMALLLTHGAFSLWNSGGPFHNPLHAASARGHEQAVRLLLQHKNKVDWKPRVALQAAIYGGHMTIVMVLVDNSADARMYADRLFRQSPFCGMANDKATIELPGIRREQDSFDWPMCVVPRRVAAQVNNENVLSLLLEKGAQVDSPALYEVKEQVENRDYTALQIAAFCGHLPAMNFLLDNGADIDSERQALGTPLQAALEGSHFDAADVLLARGANIDRHWLGFGSCLQVFCARGVIKVVEYLLDNGANIEDPGAERGNALQVACAAGHCEVARVLVSRGANVNSPPGENGTALQCACAAGQLSIVHMLLDLGADVNALGAILSSHDQIWHHERTDPVHHSGTALKRAAMNGHIVIIQLLQQHGATDDVNALLPWVAKCGHENVVRLLLKLGADVHHETDFVVPPRYPCRGKISYGNALCAACHGGSAVMADLLFDHDPWGYVQHDTFTRALRAGLAERNDEVIQVLIRKGIEIGFKKEEFRDALPYACEAGRVSFIKSLVNQFPDITTPDAMFKAAEVEQNDLLGLMIQEGALKSYQGDDEQLVVMLAVNRGMSRHRGNCLDEPEWFKVIGILAEAGVPLNMIIREAPLALAVLSQNGEHKAIEFFFRDMAHVFSKTILNMQRA